MRCVQCKYYGESPEKNERVGRCRKSPPVMVPRGDSYTFEQPHVLPDVDFCFQYIDKDADIILPIEEAAMLIAHTASTILKEKREGRI